MSALAATEPAGIFTVFCLFVGFIEFRLACPGLFFRRGFYPKDRLMNTLAENGMFAAVRIINGQFPAKM